MNDRKKISDHKNEEVTMSTWQKVYIKGIFFIGILLLLAISTLSGCATVSTVHTNVVGDGTPRDNFGPGEAINITLHGYSGQTATFYVQSISTGKTVWRRTEYIPKDWYNIIVTIGELPRGGYHAWAEVGGTSVGGWNFSVR